MKRIALICAGALVFAACAEKKEIPFEPVEQISVLANWEGEEETRSRIDPGETMNRVLWTAGDQFTMIGYNTTYSRFKVMTFTTEEDGKTSATFSGTGSLEGYSPTYSLYPSANARKLYAGGVLLSSSVFATQKAVAGSVDEGVNVAAAYSEYWKDNLNFKNVLTYVRFKMSGKMVEKLASVTFDAGKTVAGDLTIRWVDGEPVANFERYWNPIVAERSSSIKLTGPFEEGKDYFIAMVPTSLDGFNMIFTDKDGESLFLHSSLQLDMQRSYAYDFGTIDIGDQFDSEDREVIVAQEQTRGSKPNVLCVISEGFTADEMGLFKDLAQGGIDFLFSVEPFKTYKDYFKVYFLTVPSYESGASVTDGSGTVIEGKSTYFNARWGETNTGDMVADDDKVFAFVSEQCPEIANGTLRIGEVPILMIINDPRYAGITRSSDDGRSYSMVPYTRDAAGNVKVLRWSYPAVVPITDNPVTGAIENLWRPVSNADREEVGGDNYGDWRNTLLHEFGGHCFARLADEYWSGVKMTDLPVYTQSWPVPFGLNVADDPAAVLWQQDLLDRKETLVARDPHYGRIGTFQGADGFMFGRWRSEKISCMIDNRCYFSTWQRILIVKRIMEKTGGVFSLDTFFASDYTNDPVRDETSSGTQPIDITQAEEVDFLPSPVFGLTDEY